jgi:hypothetical protein
VRHTNGALGAFPCLVYVRNPLAMQLAELSSEGREDGLKVP